MNLLHACAWFCSLKSALHQQMFNKSVSNVMSLESFSSCTLLIFFMLSRCDGCDSPPLFYSTGLYVLVAFAVGLGVSRKRVCV